MFGKTRSRLVANHTSGRRLVRLNNDYTISDIFSIRRSTKDGNSDYQTTYHDPLTGEYELVCENGKDIYVWVVSPTGTTNVLANNSETVLANTPPLIKEWLLDVHTKKHVNYVPAGYGWDGKFTIAEYNKRQRANFILSSKIGKHENYDEAWIENTLDEICMTPKAFISLRWDEAYPFPDGNLIAFADGFIKRDVIFIHDNGVHTLVKQKRIIGDTTNHPGLKIPNDVSKVAILTRGVTCDEDGNMFGVGVTLLRETL